MQTGSYNPEKELNDHPQSIGLEQMDIIKQKMEKSICKIKCPKRGFGTSFFCKIPFPNEFNMLTLLITNNQVLDETDLNIGNSFIFSLKNDELVFKILFHNKRKTYTNKQYDITMIELKQSDGLKGYSFLDIDDNIFMDKPNNYYPKKTIYLIHYPNGQKVEFSSGIIKNIFEDNYTISHFCTTKTGSSGGPLINILNHKVIGLHKGSEKGHNFNLGTLLKIPIQEFNQKFNNNMNNNFNMQNNNFIKNYNYQNKSFNNNNNNQNKNFNNNNYQNINFNNNNQNKNFNINNSVQNKNFININQNKNFNINNSIQNMNYINNHNMNFINSNQNMNLNNMNFNNNQNINFNNNISFMDFNNQNMNFNNNMPFMDFNNQNMNFNNNIPFMNFNNNQNMNFNNNMSFMNFNNISNLNSNNPDINFNQNQILQNMLQMNNLFNMQLLNYNFMKEKKQNISNYEKSENLFPYIKGERKEIIFVNSKNKMYLLKIPISLRKDEIYGILENYKSSQYYELKHLMHDNEILEMMIHL